MGSNKLSEIGGEVLTIEGRPQKNDCIYFTCPICPNGHGIMVSWEAPSVVKSGEIWKKTGSTIEDITIHPSINCAIDWEDEKGKIHKATCSFHGWLKNGVVTW